MKKNNIIKGITALSVLALLGGGLVAANAASNSTGGLGAWFHNRNRTPLTAAQKTALEAKVSARQAAMTTRQAAIKTAITNNDYQAWVTAVGTSSPMVQKITTTNFPQYIQAYNLMQQARQIMTSLGLGQGQGMGGPAWGHKLGLGSEMGR